MGGLGDRTSKCGTVGVWASLTALGVVFMVLGAVQWAWIFMADPTCCKEHVPLSVCEEHHLTPCATYEMSFLGSGLMGIIGIVLVCTFACGICAVGCFERHDKMASPSVPPTACADGKTLGARLEPSYLSLFFYPACAISGYETGDLLEGICRGPALIALLLQVFCGCFGGIFALFAWEPHPSQIVGDGTQRTVKHQCCTVWCVGAPCTIAFWESGDLCAGICRGDAGLACCLAVLGPLGQFFGCCCWTPKVQNFERTPGMHGGGSSLVGEPVIVQAQTVYADQVLPQAPQPQKMGNAQEDASLEVV